MLSGFLLEHFWFGSVFLVNIPIVAVALVSGALLVPTSRDPRQRYQRREAVRSIIDQGIESGELRPGIDADLAGQLVGGTLFYQRLLLRRPADDQQLERIVDLVLDGLRA